MSVTGTCQLCGSRPATQMCDRCGTQICVMDFDAEMGFCADCADKTKADDRRGDTFQF
jgi:hypothetical protein